MKKIFFSIIFTWFMTYNSYANELEDCSIYSKLSPKFLTCKATNVAKKTMKYQNEQWSNFKKDKKNKKD